jgi:hypothetical protein
MHRNVTGYLKCFLLSIQLQFLAHARQTYTSDVVLAYVFHTLPLQVRAELGVGPDTRCVVFNYGGQPPGEWKLEASCLPPGWVCVVCSGGKSPTSKPLPSNFILAAGDTYTPDLVSKG